CQHGDGTPPTF
nr:immunoglobulin light chain junction region [Macaca mulatta]